jgi:hypothetical protein
MGGPLMIAVHSHLELTDSSHIDRAGLGLSGTLYRLRLPQLSAVAYNGEGHGCGGHHADAVINSGH